MYSYNDFSRRLSTLNIASKHTNRQEQRDNWWILKSFFCSLGETEQIWSKHDLFAWNYAFIECNLHKKNQVEGFQMARETFRRRAEEWGGESPTLWGLKVNLIIEIIMSHASFSSKYFFITSYILISSFLLLLAIPPACYYKSLYRFSGQAETVKSELITQSKDTAYLNPLSAEGIKAFQELTRKGSFILFRAADDL